MNDRKLQQVRMMEDYAGCGIDGVLHNLGALLRAGIPIRAIVAAVARAEWTRLRTSWASPKSRT